MPHPQFEELLHVPLFRTLTTTQLERLDRSLAVEPFRAGQVLAREGAAGYAFYVLHSGAADVTVGGELVGRLTSHDFFGEIALLSDGRRHATVTATEAGVAWSMLASTFRELWEQYPEIASAITDVALDRQEADARHAVR